ncbi:MAG: AmmeMemoRadiSam system radical SAM enzyme [Candidatus Izimaplasma sp.]|nr:AmmeMemoRadiSam system radical SAM enzyme [Candidatus Izimaplasma bacterium]
MKEAMFYERIGDGKVRCRVCNHYCVIAEGERGICGVRENQDNVLYALNYGLTISYGVDPIEKKPLYHFLPHTKTYSIATVGCNFKCLWCQNWEISQSPKPKKKVVGREITPEEHLKNALSRGCDSIAYTYSEPTIFLEYAYDLMKLAHENDLKNVWVSNGFMSSEVLDYILPLVDAMNIDFKGFDDLIHKKYCGAPVKPIRDNLKTIYQAGVHLEITTLVVPGVNDNLEELSKIAEFIVKELDVSVPWHITRFYPAWKMSDVKPTDVDILNKAKAVGLEKGIKNIHIGNVY